MNTTKLKDGGPAFPIPITSDPKGCVYHACEVIPGGGGMSLRAYLAARAPAEIPKWFTAKLTPRPVRPDSAEWCEGCKSDGECEGKDGCKQLRAYFAEDSKIQELNAKQIYFQWPAAYADMMIATLESLSPTPTPFLPKEFIPSVKSSFNTIVNMIDAPYFDADRKSRIRMMAVESIRMIEAAEKCIEQ